ncbi:pilus assembly protein PilC [bacterium CG17_big_fil_post_rev_8_21_14_2_50_64_8]|nr:MAG: pilus assembly protein PilC [bacterium CG17_big_fil_post_rev_8_21_14_2_50_64_8]PJA75640.1 MAG: pilus assembly protein PilC [bacterium CG_4_9_14_3_um_filter_65_15]
MSATTYLWKGRTSKGETLSGEYACDDRRDVGEYLRKRRIVITSIKKKPREIEIGFLKKQGVGVKDLSVFTRQFATMVNAGLPLVQCLDVLGRQLDKPHFKKVVQTVTSDVEGGSTLAEALEKHPKIFSDLFVNMIAAGEAGGILDVILGRLAVFLEKADALQRKVKGAMTYPTIVLTVAGGACIFMLMFVIPVFAKMFSDFGGVLPAPTRIVMNLSDFLKAYWWALGGGAAILTFIFKRYRATVNGKMVTDRLALRIPILGTVLRKSAVARFTRTLGTLIGSGVPILQGLEITAKTAGNAVIQKAIQDTAVSISQGDTIALPLKESGVFPPMVVQMISIGEQTGALDEMLSKIADFYDDEVDSAVEALTAAIEPIMIVVMGTMVGGMLVAMYLPMFKMSSVVGG